MKRPQTTKTFLFRECEICPRKSPVIATRLPSVGEAVELLRILPAVVIVLDQDTFPIPNRRTLSLPPMTLQIGNEPEVAALQPNATVPRIRPRIANATINEGKSRANSQNHGPGMNWEDFCRYKTNN